MLARSHRPHICYCMVTYSAFPHDSSLVGFLFTPTGFRAAYLSRFSYWCICHGSMLVHLPRSSFLHTYHGSHIGVSVTVLILAYLPRFSGLLPRPVGTMADFTVGAAEAKHSTYGRA